jgi:hypothetical protein
MHPPPSRHGVRLPTFLAEGLIHRSLGQRLPSPTLLFIKGDARSTTRTRLSPHTNQQLLLLINPSTVTTAGRHQGDGSDQQQKQRTRLGDHLESNAVDPRAIAAVLVHSH